MYVTAIQHAFSFWNGFNYRAKTKPNIFLSVHNFYR